MSNPWKASTTTGSKPQRQRQRQEQQQELFREEETALLSFFRQSDFDLLKEKPPPTNPDACAHGPGPGGPLVAPVGRAENDGSRNGGPCSTNPFDDAFVPVRAARRDESTAGARVGSRRTHHSFGHSRDRGRNSSYHNSSNTRNPFGSSPDGPTDELFPPPMLVPVSPASTDSVATAATAVPTGERPILPVATAVPNDSTTTNTVPFAAAVPIESVQTVTDAEACGDADGSVVPDSRSRSSRSSSSRSRSRSRSRSNSNSNSNNDGWIGGFSIGAVRVEEDRRPPPWTYFPAGTGASAPAGGSRPWVPAFADPVVRSGRGGLAETPPRFSGSRGRPPPASYFPGGPGTNPFPGGFPRKTPARDGTGMGRGGWSRFSVGTAAAAREAHRAVRKKLSPRGTREGASADKPRGTRAGKGPLAWSWKAIGEHRRNGSSGPG
ncbi:unnamed protein product [Pseudo-nitzschia multistriata]|uniref:Uncharacterized protein n=1 Tax=Pseudo-nitzschia multistriata TaxID=183589 RepID=A0A448ZQC4_9STRA|nr:unnamed protein product [Pseudo-nitzschia multistriata]